MSKDRGRVLVLGAGVMGHSIAQICALGGYHTTLTDVSVAVLDGARAKIAANLDAGVARGKVTSAARRRALALIEITPDRDGAAAAADIVIEAVAEDLPLKQRLMAELSAVCRPDAVLATNTSSLSVAAIASAATHPERVIGAHFFNPPHIVRLLEIVVAASTSEATVARLVALGEATGRETITVTDSPGFATSRLGLVLGLEAIRMVEQGVATPADIDRGMELGYRHAMGPLRLSDVVGLDTRLRIADYLRDALGSEAFRAPDLLRRMVAEGKLGKKSGEGFYRW
jgi:3-hydroxybutyryl-CoA dehydrogenase